MKTTATAQIIDAIGSDLFRETFGITKSYERSLRHEEKFPASMYLVLRVMLERRDMPCPYSAFRWKSPLVVDPVISERLPDNEKI